MDIVLPDCNLSNPSLAWLRRWAEGKARLLAVVSLPEETFRSGNATVKASLVFLRRVTIDDEVGNGKPPGRRPMPSSMNRSIAGASHYTRRPRRAS